MQGISYEWIYNEPDDYLPIRIFVEGKNLDNLGITSGVWGANRESFLVAYDQVGTLRALINSHGDIVKRIDYDSFGNILYDSLPEFFIPQGFATGMTDRVALYLRKARSSPTQTPSAPVG